MERVIKAFIGANFMLSGVLLYGFVHSVAGRHYPMMTGWSSPPGKFILSLQQTASLLPAFISLTLFIAGLFILIKEYKNN